MTINAGAVTAAKVAADVATQAELDAHTSQTTAAHGGIVPSARTISTTAPLAGGGSLAANRTLTVAAATATAVGVVELATTAETTTGTDTTRAVTPAGVKAVSDLLMPRALVDAKGDLIAASAADTVGRLAVGTNGQVLTADSSASLGVKWADPSGGGGGVTFGHRPSAMAGWADDGWRGPVESTGGWSGLSPGASQSATRGAPVFALFPVAGTMTFKAVGAFVKDACGTSGSTLRLGVFDSHPTSGLPHAVLADVTAGSADTTGGRSAVISLTLDPGLYWLAAVIQWASDPGAGANPTIGAAEAGWSFAQRPDTNNFAGRLVSFGVHGALTADPTMFLVSSSYQMVPLICLQEDK